MRHFRTHPATGNPSALSFVSDGAGHVTRRFACQAFSFAKVQTALMINRRALVSCS